MQAQLRQDRLDRKRARPTPNRKKKSKLTDVCIRALTKELELVDEYGLTMRQLKHVLKLRHNLKRDKLVEKARNMA